MVPSVLIAFASWEDRFAEGVLRDLDELGCTEVVVFWYGSYRERTAATREHVRSMCQDRSVDYSEVELATDKPQENLRTLDLQTARMSERTSCVVTDISTMPREVIWHLFWLCERYPITLRYRYHSPHDYSADWLSRDPGRPRLVQKLSGIALPQAKTALLLAVGFDFQRVSQLVRFFEPTRLLLGLQADSPFPLNDPMMQRYVEGLRGETFSVDAFGEDHGFGVFASHVADLVGGYNVVLGSLGPKLSAVSLYRIRQQWPQVGLVYAPANDFNLEYSYGIGASFAGTMEPPVVD